MDEPVAVGLVTLVYQFGPDGSDDSAIPAGIAPPVRRALARLRSRRPSRRCEAAFELGRLQAQAAAPYLIPLLQDGADAMGPAERILQSVTMGGLSRPVSSCAETALEQLGAVATPHLIAAFQRTGPALQRPAAHLLALSPDPQAAQFMSSHLEHPDAAVRREALIAVAQSQRPDRIAALRRALQDSDSQVRQLALGYASSEREPWVFDALVLAANDPASAVRALAVDRLGFRGEPRAIEPLIARLSDPDLSVRQNAHNSLRLLQRVGQGPNPASFRDQ